MQPPEPNLPAPFAGIAATPLKGDATRETTFTLESDNVTPEQAVVISVAQSALLHFPAPNPCGAAALVIGGGGYVQLMAGREGVQVAHWLNALGIDAHVLIHRFPDAANGPNVALEDALCAMRSLRERGMAKVGVIGLSSGGHLGACLLGQMDATRPDFAVIGYAPISTNAVGRTVVANKPALEPPEKQAFYDTYQPDAQLADGPPPCFIVYAAIDPVVPVTNAYRLGSAIEAHGGHAALHIFAQGPHGFALDTVGLPVSEWPRLCEGWMREEGVIPRA